MGLRGVEYYYGTKEKELRETDKFSNFNLKIKLMVSFGFRFSSKGDRNLQHGYFCFDNEV